MNVTYRTLLIAGVLLLTQGRAASEDIELFVNHEANAEPPSVLFVIDNGANFSASAATGTCVLGGATNTLQGTAGGIEQCALHQVIAALPAGSVKIGVMVYNDPNVVPFDAPHCRGNVPNTPGGCLVYPMELMDDEHKAEILGWIRSWRAETGSVPGQIKGNTKRTGSSMQEAFAYYEGRTGLSGYNYADDAPDPSCNRYIIYIGNSSQSSGSPGDQIGNFGPRNALNGTNATSGMNASPVATATQQVTIGRTITTTCGTVNLGAGPHENNGYYADEWARYLEETHDITTYSIGVLNPQYCQASYAGTLTSMASVGGGRYFPTTNFDELVIALQTALSEMLSVNSVFASVSLPVSVHAQGTYLNQVYVGMFRPNENVRPRWHGNLKQYRLGLVNGALRLLDAQDPGQPAISSADTGFLSACARSYWTPSTVDNYWQTYNDVIPPYDTVVPEFCSGYPAVSNTPDGNLVEKGGQGYTLRGSRTATSISRNLMTCNASCSADLVAFNDANTAITATRLGDAAMTAADRTALIDWARGLNNAGDELDPAGEPYVASTAMRPSVHGDVLHSRPVAINYASPEDNPPKVVVFYGGNDGVLRAVNGNRSEDIIAAPEDVPAGHEMWSFLPPEFYPHIKQLRDNSQELFFHGEDPSTKGTRLEKPYGFDGPLTAYRSSDHADTWIFAGMRRGGRMVYAFDVSDITTDTTSPTLKWRIGCPNLYDDTGCTSSDIADIGQTWSSPMVLKTAGHFDVVSVGGVDTNVPQPMLIMGGGYDECEDADPDTCTSSTKGNRIFVLDADSGDVIASLATDRAVVGDVFVISNPSTGLAQWAYAADLGGNIYRISGVNANTPFNATAPANWTITKIAALGCSDGGTCTDNRKFLFAPDVIVEPAPNSGTHILLIGSGDREKPVLEYSHAYATDNYFFMIKDVPAASNWLTTDMGDCSGAICLDALFRIERNADNPTDEDLADTKGWYLEMDEHEQVVTSAITVFGSVTFSTHIPYVPGGDTCSSDLGVANVYNVRYLNAAPSRPGALNRYEEIAGGGLPPSPVAGQVRLDTGEIVPFIIGADPDSPLEGGLPVPPSLATSPKSITYWYIEKR
jgi:type IV pilus assembly protein PilY1